MAVKDTRTQQQKADAEARLTDPGIYMIGDKVIYDGEPVTLGVPPLPTLPKQNRLKKPDARKA